MTTTSLVDNAIDLPWRNRKVRSLGQSPRGKYPDFWRYPNFLIKPARFVQSFRYIPACDKQTDKRTHDDSMYLASIWLRGNKILNVTGGRCPRRQFSVWGEGGECPDDGRSSVLDDEPRSPPGAGICQRLCSAAIAARLCCCSSFAVD